MDAFTLTFGDCMENHVGMQKIGFMSKNGFSLEDLIRIKSKFTSKKTELVHLNRFLDPNNEFKADNAYILIIRNGIDNPDEIINEHKGLVYDKKYYDTRRQKVLNKLARWNLCFDDTGQKCDFENKKGTIIAYKDVPHTNQLRKLIRDISLCTDLKLEANYYYDIKKTGIGFHGDSERKKVVGVRFGKPNTLVFKWFHDTISIGNVFSTTLNSGDIYVMSEKAVGTDWKSRSKITLRHAAGCKKYTGL
jgi:hypothetical protein